MLDATARLYGVTPADLAGSQLLAETLDPDEVAAAVAFCCSREGRVLNGSVVAADGGFAEVRPTCVRRTYPIGQVPPLERTALSGSPGS